jgi:hypothetical protein
VADVLVIFVKNLNLVHIAVRDSGICPAIYIMAVTLAVAVAITQLLYGQQDTFNAYICGFGTIVDPVHNVAFIG